MGKWITKGIATATQLSTQLDTLPSLGSDLSVADLPFVGLNC